MFVGHNSNTSSNNNLAFRKNIMNSDIGVNIQIYIKFDMEII